LLHRNKAGILRTSKFLFPENTMNPISVLTMAATLLLSGSAMAAEPAKCSAPDFDYRQYEVFVDAPTGYAFIKTPCGWHFVRKIEADRIATAIEVTKNTPHARPDSQLMVTLLQPSAM
jgi:hypothetical protein